MIRNFTDDEMAVLSKFEGHLKTAYQLGFKRPSPAADNNIVCDILEAATGQKYSRTWTCGHCLWKVWSEAGRIYFKTLKDNSEAAEKPAEEKKPTLSERMKAYWAKKKAEQNGNESITEQQDS